MSDVAFPTFDQYRAIQATNWSQLKHLRESPLKYRYMQTAEEDVDTASRALGRAVHSLVFEPGTFARDYAIYDGGDRRGKDWLAFRDANEGKTIFKPNEIGHVEAMAKAVRVHPLVAPYLDDGQFEQTITWTDPQSGEPCKARIDWWSKSKKALLDLKSSTSIDAFLFGRVAARLGYASQLAHYYNGVRFGMRQACAEVAIVAVESKPPYDVAFFTVTDDALFAGQEEVARLIRQLQECRSTNKWPGRYTEKQMLALSEYAYGDEEIAVTEEA